MTQPVPFLAPPVLDHLSWHSLNGPHAHLAEVHGRARRYHPDFAAYSALHPDRDARAWRDLATLAGPGVEVVLAGAPFTPPPGWVVSRVGNAVQLVADASPGRPDSEAVLLGPDHAPEIAALIERTRPGPWRPRTVELGRYLGIRRHGQLVAMAGERVRVPGWTEISAVCTDPAFRGQGLAARLVSAVVHSIRARGDEVLLHTGVDNAPARRLYERLGFRVRRETVFLRLVTPS
ncbi:GNAT family N-acetyltransferase [Kineosporia sp. J2-2]|uniref:GNAT family N-acetyltransferase n=1 Tax=Kineosporia corallincola TaxID=2835133 RepID=A0ABS5TC99_9ACTN|nr:GNAT family N-acetyltransferase [Kineosporia corallincola]MBT0768709.1 GNAT family N-acetyltransferase [Kineosporia corallincola]